MLARFENDDFPCPNCETGKGLPTAVTTAPGFHLIVDIQCPLCEHEWHQLRRSRGLTSEGLYPQSAYPRVSESCERQLTAARSTVPPATVGEAPALPRHVQRHRQRCDLLAPPRTSIRRRCSPGAAAHPPPRSPQHRTAPGSRPPSCRRVSLLRALPRFTNKRIVFRRRFDNKHLSRKKLDTPKPRSAMRYCQPRDR